MKRIIFCLVPAAFFIGFLFILFASSCEGPYSCFSAHLTKNEVINEYKGHQERFSEIEKILSDKEYESLLIQRGSLGIKIQDGDDRFTFGEKIKINRFLKDFNFSRLQFSEKDGGFYLMMYEESGLLNLSKGISYIKNIVTDPKNQNYEFVANKLERVEYNWYYFEFG
jgi:hypothetical protein